MKATTTRMRPVRALVMAVAGVALSLCAGAQAWADDEDEDDDDDDRPAQRAEEDGAGKAFQDRFEVQKEELASRGINPFFALEPGWVLVLEKQRKDGKVERLTITVLDETRQIDGVETRVVEERETVGDEVKEVCRNYFAISTRTQDVYYFGEDTGGAWESGRDGARFGLIMPGKPAVGMRFQQEIAPGVAMDRCEVVSVDATYETPAGKFEHCLKVKETTPLEPGEVEYKYYAPGVGLLMDEGLKLVRVTKPGGK